MWWKYFFKLFHNHFFPRQICATSHCSLNLHRFTSTSVGLSSVLVSEPFIQMLGVWCSTMSMSEHSWSFLRLSHARRKSLVLQDLAMTQAVTHSLALLIKVIITKVKSHADQFMSPEISLLQMFRWMCVTPPSEEIFPFRSVKLEGLICLISISPQGSRCFMLLSILNYSFMQCCVLPTNVNPQAFQGNLIGVLVSKQHYENQPQCKQCRKAWQIFV